MPNSLIQLCTQTGVLSYSVNVAPVTTAGSFFMGFTGVTGINPPGTLQDNIFFGWSGASGMLYDTNGTFFGSYQAGVPFSLSGYVYPTYYNYFLNKEIINTSAPRTTGYIESFVYNTGNQSISAPQVNLWGNTANPYISGAIFNSGAITGNMPILNNNNLVRFQIYSGTITYGQFTFPFPCYSGYITGTQNYNLISNQPLPINSTQQVSGTFYTNFGVIQTGFSAQSLYNLYFLLNITPPNFLSNGSGVGTINYQSYFGSNQDSTQVTNLSIFLQDNNIGQVLKNTNLTGYTIQSIVNIPFTGYASGSGIFTTTAQISGTGYNPKFQFSETGLINFPYNYQQYATGTFNTQYFQTSNASGSVSGFSYEVLPFSGGINVSQTSNIATSYPIYGSGLAYYLFNTGGTGFCTTFNESVTGLFSGYGYSTTIAYATGSGIFGYTGISTGIYTGNNGYLAMQIFAGNVMPTGTGNFTIAITVPVAGGNSFTQPWTGFYNLTDQLGNITGQASPFTTGMAYVTGTYYSRTGEFYLMGGVTGGAVTTQNGFVYCTGYTGAVQSWMPQLYGTQQFMTLTSGLGNQAIASPYQMTKSGTLYSASFYPTGFGANGQGISGYTVTGLSGFIFLSNYGAADASTIPNIFNTGGSYATNYLKQIVWVKHNRPPAHKMDFTYSVIKYKQLTPSGLNGQAGSPATYSYPQINAYLVSTGVGSFANPYYISGAFCAANVANDPTQESSMLDYTQTNYNNAFNQFGFDTGVYISLSMPNNNLVSDSYGPTTGVFMFVWQSGHVGAGSSVPSITPLFQGGEFKSDAGYTGNLFTGQSFYMECPTGELTVPFCATNISTGLWVQEQFFPLTSGSVYTGIGTGEYVTGYINYPIQLTGTSGAILFDATVNATGLSSNYTISNDVGVLKFSTYRVGFQINQQLSNSDVSDTIFFQPYQTGGLNFASNVTGTLYSINSNYSRYGFTGITGGTVNTIIINYTGGYTGNPVLDLTTSTQTFNGAPVLAGLGIVVNSNLVTGRNLYYTPNVTGNSQYYGNITITNPIVTGLGSGNWSGYAIGTGFISGISTFTINPGSGFWNYPPQISIPAANSLGVTGYPSSGLFSIGSFTGTPAPFVGTGNYFEISGINFTNLTGVLAGTSYVKTFTGEYTFNTGYNLNSLVPVPSLVTSIATGYSGYSQVSGANSFYYSIFKNYNTTGDVLILSATGYNNSSATITINT